MPRGQAVLAGGKRPPAGPGPRTTRVAWNATVVVTAEVAGKLATFAFTVAAARSLGAQGFGAFAYALSFALLAGAGLRWGFSERLVKEASAQPDRLPRLVSETLTWRALLALPLLAVALAGAALRPDRAAAVALVLVCVATAIDELCMDTGRAAADALQDQAWVSRALVLERLAQAALGVAALAAGLGLVGLAGGYLGGTVLGALAVGRGLRRLGLPDRPVAPGRSALAASFRGSLAYGVNAMLAMALFRVDQVMLSALAGDAALGPYAAAYRLVETVMFVAWAAVRAVFPAMSAATAAWQVLRGLEQAVAGVAVLYVPFAVGLALEADLVVAWLFGPAYQAAAVPAARWLAGTPLLFAIGFFGIYAALARGLRWRLVLVTGFSLAVNVGANLALIPRLAGTGAAIATTASYAVQAALYLALLRPELGWVRLHRGLAVPAAAALPMAGALGLAHLGLVAETLLGLGVYAAAWFPLARWLAPGQVDVVAAVLRRSLRRDPDPRGGR